MPRPCVRRVARVAAAAVAGLLLIRTSQAQSARPMLPVGLTSRSFVPAADYNWRGAHTHALVTDIWYPAAAGTKMAAVTVGPADDPQFTLGEWASNATPADGRFPLVVLSHGTGGSARIMSWLAVGLASRGYVVAAVNHPGNTALEEYTAEGFLVWWERARDLSTAIDFVLRDEALSKMIDRQRIGAAGFSLGGYTMFEIAGARTDPSLFLDYCRSAGAEGCADPPEFPNLFARWKELEATSPSLQAAMKQAGDSYRDARVRAAFAIAPALGPAFTADSLKAISIPIQIVAGEADEIVPVAANARRLAETTPGAALTLIPGAGHYTFLATCTDAGRRDRPQLCTDGAGVNREAVHQRTVEQAASFFDRTLR